jgi:hypothetical protein
MWDALMGAYSSPGWGWLGRGSKRISESCGEKEEAGYLSVILSRGEEEDVK